MEPRKPVCWDLVSVGDVVTSVASLANAYERTGKLGNRTTIYY